MFCLCSDMITEWPCFYLDPLGSQSGLVHCSCSVKLFSFSRKTPKPSCQCQVSSEQHQGTLAAPGQLLDVKGAFFLLSVEGPLALF